MNVNNVESPPMRRSLAIRASWLLPLCPILVGCIAFVVVVGAAAIRPDNIAWLCGGDPATYHLGWLFFKDTPWTLPPGSNPNYGLEFASGILYSDSIPLLALPFKLFVRWMPGDFQYFGLWILLCFILQSWFAWKLAGILTDSAVVRLCAAVTFVFAPAFLFRLTGHYPLMGQWTILAAIYLNFSPNFRLRHYAWPTLTFASALINTYLMVMVLSLWLADVSRRFLWKEGQATSLATEAAATLGLTVFALWLAGFFVIKSGYRGGRSYYGERRFNLLSLIDPQESGLRFSQVLPDLPTMPGDYEGFNFLGLGGLLICLAAVLYLVVTARRPTLDRRWLPLCTILAGLTLFAISHHIGLGDRELVITMPQRLIDLCGVLRSSGRMVWPLYYCILWAAIGIVAQGYRRWMAMAILAIAAMLQVIDTRLGWEELGRRIAVHSGPSWPTPLTSPFWSEASSHYRKVRVTPKGVGNKNWSIFAYYAAKHGMATDSAYLARIDGYKYVAALTKSESALHGTVESDTLYILENETQAEEASHHLSDDDLLDRIDGFYVIAPGWNRQTNAAHE